MRFRSDVSSVVKEFIDVNGDVTTDPAQYDGFRVTMTFSKNQAESKISMLYYVSEFGVGTATFEVHLPTDFEGLDTTGNIISGGFQLGVTDLTGTSHSLVYDGLTPVSQIQDEFRDLFPELGPFLYVSDDSGYGHYPDSRSISFTFNSPEIIPLFTIMNDPASPVQGNNVVLEVLDLLPPSNNWFYSPIPGEWLKTMAQTSQVHVTSNGFDAICLPGACDFTYLPDEYIIDSATYDDLTGTLVIGGTLPTSGYTLFFNDDECAI